MEDLTAISCDAIGVSGTTKIHFREAGGRIEARMGIAILGMTNGEHAPDANPFLDSFRDNYACGSGVDRAAALQDLKEDIRRVSDSLWAE